MRLTTLLLLSAMAAPALALQCPATVPVQGAPIAPSPVFPSDNWWNQNIVGAPVDTNSANFISFIGTTRQLHPDFGGVASGDNIYGIPYAVVSDTQPKQNPIFQYATESDNVGYPIPAEAITQAHWIEGGPAGNVDQRSSNDRHLLMIDCVNNYLYELYNVYFNTSQNKWYAGSGAFFDMNTNNRRPDGWTSADAAGLAIFPGLLRWDEVYGSGDIQHAIRVTLRASNNYYVYPASHKAGANTSALPFGARLRLKGLVNGSNPALRSANPAIQKIFKAMQQYGLIFADNGSDMYISGTFDTRWDNNILNPAFKLLTASDFEVIQLGWKPSLNTPAALNAISATPTSIVGGSNATGTITLSGAAPTGGIQVSLASSNSTVTIPNSVTVAEGASTASFAITSTPVSTNTATTLSAAYNNVNKTTTLTVTPPAPPVLSTLTISPTSVVGGGAVTGTVSLDKASLQATTITLKSSNTKLAKVPASIVIPVGSASQVFAVTTAKTNRNISVTITATYGGLNRASTLTVKK